MKSVKTSICLFSFFFAILLAISLFPPLRNIPSGDGERFVSLSIILDMGSDNWVEDYYNRLESFLRACSFQNWTFCTFQRCQDAWLTNSTRLTLLKNYGVLIPRIDYAQTLSLANRSELVDAIFANWSSFVGYYPKGVFDYVPDTYVANYVRSKYNCSFYQGYCFDQYRIDCMSMRGGWQLPYYADSDNIMVPGQGRGIVILSHASWDWIDSFLLHHNLQLHPMNLMQHFKNNAIAERYFLDLIARTSLGCTPFSLSIVQFEWRWCCNVGSDNATLAWIRHLLSYDYIFWSFENIVEWFSNHFVDTPEYHVRFASPNSETYVEWVYTHDYRISRVANTVNSLIRYCNQKVDKYLHSSISIDWSRSSCPNEADNQIDISLDFAIDALGGGTLRAPVKTESLKWSGDLRDFPSYYASLQGNAS
jgi:hypothetical protein